MTDVVIDEGRCSGQSNFGASLRSPERVSDVRTDGQATDRLPSENDNIQGTDPEHAAIYQR
jgi:hypothetical protein